MLISFGGTKIYEFEPVIFRVESAIWPRNNIALTIGAISDGVRQLQPPFTH